MGKIVYKNVKCFRTIYNSRNPAQFGVSSGKATINFNNFIYYEPDNNNVLSLFADFQKEFDTVYHYLLLHKLYAVAFRRLYLFFDNHFFNRVQRVKVGISLSKNTVVIFCIRQGSVRGPLLFIICERSCYYATQIPTLRVGWRHGPRISE